MEFISAIVAALPAKTIDDGNEKFLVFSLVIAPPGSILKNGSLAENPTKAQALNKNGRVVRL